MSAEIPHRRRRAAQSPVRPPRYRAHPGGIIEPVKVLVTGGAGFVGSHVVDLLLGAGAGVRVVDSLEAAPDRTVPAYLDPAAELLVGDVGDPEVAAAAVAGVDAVCHQAAKVGLGVDFGDVGAYVAANDTGTASLLHALWRRSFRGRLVLASSMVVYGEGRYRCEEHGEVRPPPRTAADLTAGHFEPVCPHAGCARPTAWAAIDERAPTDPRNVYAATKLHQEHLCGLWGREAGATVVALRYHNVYGPRMPRDTPYAGVASLFRSALASGRAPEVFEDGGQTRDFVHVRDVARANVLALTADAVDAGAYNVASGTPHTVGQLAGALTAALAPDLTPVVTGRWRLGDVRHVVASPARAAAALGFRAEVGFEAGMAEFAGALDDARR
ncbi:MAG: dTDP-L-rhamnose 4-epimerase [Actinomycetota bacterium]|nr:dTDP-L-rhamnose 4-epimerase [Actinomycetota bacterium]